MVADTFKLMSGDNVAPVVILAIAFVVGAYRRAKAEGGTSFLSFNLRRNMLLTLITANSLACMFLAIPIAVYTQTSRAGAAAIILCVEAVGTTVLCGLHTRSISPWDSVKWDLMHASSNVRIRLIVLQVWFGLSFLGAWVARWFILQQWLDIEPVNAAASSDFGKAVLGTTITGFIQSGLLLFWCCWFTFWDRVAYESYLCPACHGSRPEAQCLVCKQGIIMQHA